MNRFILFIALITLSFSCDYQSDDIDSFINVNVKEYNDKILSAKSNGEFWTDEPIFIVRKLFKSGDFERKVIIDVDGKSMNELTITFTKEGLEDDSVDGEKRIIEFKREKEIWTIKNIKLGIKCWDSRGGHTNYSGEGCP